MKDIDLFCSESEDRISIYSGDSEFLIKMFIGNEPMRFIVLDYQSAKKLQAFINQNTRRGGRQR